eukprot:4499060-Amphidinium_carterae.1
MLARSVGIYVAALLLCLLSNRQQQWSTTWKKDSHMNRDERKRTNHVRTKVEREREAEAEGDKSLYMVWMYNAAAILAKSSPEPFHPELKLHIPRAQSVLTVPPQILPYGN